MENTNKILLIPDAYLGNQSGAIVTQVAKKLLLQNGNEVSIFSSDIAKDTTDKDGTKLYHRESYSRLAYRQEKKYIIGLISVRMFLSYQSICSLINMITI